MWLSVKETACNAGDTGLILGLGRSPGEGNGNPFQYSCLGNPMDREASWATVHRIIRVRHDLVTKPPPSKRLSSCHMLSGEPLHSKGKKWTSPHGSEFPLASPR